MADKPPVCLTIAGLDPSGGAGIVADISTFLTFGCLPAAAVTSVTFQNAKGVFGAVHQTADSVRQQIEAVLDECDLAAVKTGMLPTDEIVETVVAIIADRKLKNVIVDPVMRSTSGHKLMDERAVEALVHHLFPIADLVTPNIPEAERLTNIDIKDEKDIERAANAIRSTGARNVLIKGGHLPRMDRATDHLFIDHELTKFDANFIEGVSMRGTGCMLASAIAANMALGKELKESVKVAKEFVSRSIRNASRQITSRA
jgi:hydroxymethylpyrimidine kinase/phosphomethylpyrimidine kinase